MEQRGRALPEVLLDCLHMNLEDSGGVARYTARLREGLVEHVAAGTAPRFRFEAVHVWSPPVAPDPGPEPQRLHRPSLGDAAKAIAREVLPPIVVRGLGAGVRRVRDSGRAVLRMQPRAEAGRPRLIHQVMQYIVGSTVERFAADASVRICVTVIDHQELFFPDFFTADEVARRHASSQFFARRSDHAFAISQFSKDVYCERYGVDPSRVTVTHLAPELLRGGGVSSADTEWARRFGRYLLYPAKPWAHKNHARLFEAIALGADALRAAGVRLLLSGGFSAPELQRVNASLKRLRIADLVMYTGFVTEGQLAALYGSADWLVFPSLFEGFGMPVVEAMQAGCPVLASNSTALPEVCGDAAILFDATDVDAMAELFVAAARVQLERAHYVTLGQANAQRFRWRGMTALTLDAYARLLD